MNSNNNKPRLIVSTYFYVKSLKTTIYIIKDQIS